MLPEGLRRAERIKVRDRIAGRVLVVEQPLEAICARAERRPLPNDVAPRSEGAVQQGRSTANGDSPAANCGHRDDWTLLGERSLHLRPGSAHCFELPGEHERLHTTHERDDLFRIWSWRIGGFVTSWGGSSAIVASLRADS